MRFLHPHSLSLLSFGILTQLFIPRLDSCGHGTCTSDADGDGVCDPVDACPGYDDNLDADQDGKADGCDACPQDAVDDANKDGICDSAPALTLSSLPADIAVLQRGADNKANLTVTGNVSVTGYESASLEIDQNSVPFQTVSAPLGGNGAFSLQVGLPAGEFNYTARLNLIKSGTATRVATRFQVASGDLVLIQGQSNAVAGDYFSEGLANQSQSPWIRSFGSTSLDPATVQADLTWGMADGQAYYAHASVGAWGLRMAELMLEQNKVPVGLLNGAVGGTYIAQHQRNDANPEDLNTIYGRFLYRANRAVMAKQARFIVWYQGESDGYGWGEASNAATYRSLFTDMRADWKQDFPGIERMYVFQVRNGCGLDHPSDGSSWIEFLDINGTLLDYKTQDYWATPSWTYYGVTRTAPANTAYVATALLGTGYGAIDLDDASLSAPDGVQMLNNSGFETGTSTFPDGWAFYSAGAWSWLQGGAHTGSRAMSIQSGADVSDVYQYQFATPGVTYSTGAYARAEYTGTYFDIREVLRTLPASFPDITVMSTNGAPQHDGCHFYYSGYRELGDRIGRLVLRDFYGTPDVPGILPPEAGSATLAPNGEIRISINKATDGLTLEAGAEQNFRVPGAYVTAARVENGNTIVLTLSHATTATALSYTDPLTDGPDILNSQGVGMLSFADLPLARP